MTNLNSELTPSQKSKRQRLRDDFEYWAAACYTIIDKDGEFTTLKLNAAQRHVYKEMKRMEAAGLPIRIIILKGRQQGISTLIEAWQLWRTSQNAAKRAYVLAHVALSTNALFEQTRRGYDNLPDIMKPKKRRSNTRELVFGELDSSLNMATAGGSSIGRGSTFQYVHASEVGFWESGTAETNWNGLYATVPNSPDSLIAVESTANGIGGLFHRLWTDAERGQSEFTAIFIPWFWSPEYRMPASEDFQPTPMEADLIREFSLDPEQLTWRRGKVRTVGLDLFNQEYPNTPKDAFLTSGRPVFEPILIHRALDAAPEPIMRMALEVNSDDEEVFVEHSRGELSIYESPDPGGAYYIGADVAEGVRDGDWSVAQVLNGKREQVAVWRGLIYPDAFANVLAALGDLYNDALVAVELNNHGILTANVLAKDLAYPNVFTDITVDKITDEETVRLGFTQNPKTRPMIINKLRAEVRDGTILIRDRMTMKEMLSFAVTSGGRMEAEASAHDDHVMSLAICNHVNEGEWKPIINKSDWYKEAY